MGPLNAKCVLALLTTVAIIQMKYLYNIVEDFTFTNLNDNPNAIYVTVETDCGMQKVLIQNQIKKTTTTIVISQCLAGVFSCIFPSIFKILVKLHFPAK